MQVGETIEAPTTKMRVTCRELTSAVFGFDLWVLAGAATAPMHVHPRQEERVRVVGGAALSRSGGRERALGPGDSVVTPAGEPHTIGPVDAQEIQFYVELVPALTYADFLERLFALDRAGHLSAHGRGNPLRLATAGSHEAEFFYPRAVGAQRAVLGGLSRLGKRLYG